MRITRRRFLAGLGAGSALVAAGIGGFSPMRAAGLSRTAASSAPDVPRSDDLRETGDLQRRWLSLPGSRIVINPFDFNTSLTPVQYNNAPELPLHVGYYASDTAYSLREILSLYRKPKGLTGGFSVAFEDDFNALSPDWGGDSWVSRQIVDGELEMTVEPSGPVPWGATQRWLTIDLDKYPYVQLSVPQAEGAWSLKVNDGTLAVDIALQGDTHQTGIFTYDVAQATGWSGTKKFELRIFAIGYGQPVYADYVRILGVNQALFGASSYSTSWLPYELPFSATFDHGSQLEGQDFLYDADTIARTVQVSVGDTSDDQWAISGRYHGSVSWDGQRGVLTVAGGDYAYAIATTATVTGDVSYFGSVLEMMAWTDQLSQPGTDGYWALQARLSGQVAFGVGLATAAEGAPVAGQRALAVLRGRSADARRIQQKTFWDGVLARVPHPQSFALTSVPDYGVTAEQVRHSYYTAWVFAVANSLPVMPETGYAYPQIPAGKPSMWVYGAPGAKPSAAWESFLGQQFYAYYDPDTAWAAYEGLMSLVDPSGELGGESLPSRKAQTAWVLYQITDDDRALRSVYPALKRHLLWEYDHPYWIPPGQTGNPNQRDAEFVVSLIVDMGYAREIAQALGDQADVALWDSRRRSMFQSYLEWFWETPTSEPMQYYYTDTGERNPGNTVWVTTGLHLDLLEEGAYLDGLKQRFLSDFDPNGTFNSFAYPKYPDMSFTLYGLIERGMLSEAEVFLNTAIRDVTRASMFSEQYHERGFPNPTGVRPSLFGDCMMIDFVWVRNGYRMDQGWPSFVRINKDEGGVSGLAIRNKQLAERLDPAAGGVKLSGSLVRETPACRQLQVQPGQTVPLPEGCATGAG